MNFNLEIFNNAFDFEKTALAIFQFQAKENSVYKKYLRAIHVEPNAINELTKIPFLPVQFFKTHKINTGNINDTAQIIFSSSGTTGAKTSKHYVQDIKIYEQSFLKGFSFFYGDIKDYCILALLPSYLEREGSSLIYMVDELIKQSSHAESNFYLNEFDTLFETIVRLQNQNQKFILLGVTYALLDFAGYLGLKNNMLNFNNGIIMETGGMKGKRKEMLREEVHAVLSDAFGVTQIHSEYGMTELLSQAYSKGNGFFKTPPWMKILIRDINDPMTIIENGKTGGINIIDLANIHSCSFIATQDLGKTHSDERFEILGRFDNSDLRGCNLLVQ